MGTPPNNTEEFDRTALDLRSAEPRAEGDDIVVIPGGEPSHEHRTREIIVAAIVVAVLAVGIAVALVTRSSGSKHTAINASTPPAAPSANSPATNALPTKPKTHKSTPASPVAPPNAVVTSPPITRAPGAVSPPPTPAPVLKDYPASMLRWDAPHSFSIKQGYTKTITVTAHNPTSGNITLGHPLSCAPRLDHSEICPAMAQILGAGQSASATYKIDTIGITPGTYTLSVEGLLTITVTVTA